MDKILLKNDFDLYNAIEKFGDEWKDDIKKEVTKYPCILIHFYAEDIDFGSIYRFTGVLQSDFN
tara:strand:- start:1070 stop:1261 length:192 start_codon:yes stop_codon:yes gene_type:complete